MFSCGQSARVKRDSRLVKVVAWTVVIVFAIGLVWGRALVDWYADAPRGAELLFCAASSGPVADIDRALDQGVDVNARTDGGMTALMLAAGSQRPELIRELLARGADPNAEAFDALTALYVAIEVDDAEAIEMLLARGADPNKRHRDETALDVAIRLEKAASIRVLVNHHAMRAA